MFHQLSIVVVSFIITNARGKIETSSAFGLHRNSGTRSSDFNVLQLPSHFSPSREANEELARVSRESLSVSLGPGKSPARSMARRRKGRLTIHAFDGWPKVVDGRGMAACRHRYIHKSASPRADDKINKL